MLKDSKVFFLSGEHAVINVLLAVTPMASPLQNPGKTAGVPLIREENFTLYNFAAVN